MRLVVWSQDALGDFTKSMVYLAAANRRAAELVADRVEETANQLGDMAIGYPGRVRNTYEKRVLKTEYIIAYAVAAKQITILRVIHMKRDWPEGEWPE